MTVTMTNASCVRSLRLVQSALNGLRFAFAVIVLYFGSAFSITQCSTRLQPALKVICVPFGCIDTSSRP